MMQLNATNSWSVTRSFFTAVVFIVLQASAAESLPENFEKRVFDNGLTVIVEEDHRLPVVAIETWFRGGSSQEQEYLGSGVCHLIEHMLFKGTHSREVGRIGQEIKALGGDIGGYTSLDQTVYTIDVPSASLDKALEISADAILNSSVDPEEFEKEREVVYKEINLTRDEPGKFLFQKLFEEAFTDHPYRFPVIGYKDRMQALSAEEVYSFYKRMYTPNNLVVVVVGDVEASHVFTKLEELYRTYKRGQPLPLIHVPEREQTGSRSAWFEKDIAQARVLMGWRGPGMRDKDLFAMDVAASVLGDGTASRLHRILKEEKQLVYDISSFSFTPREGGMLGISFSAEPDNVEDVKQIIRSEIAKLAKELAGDAELNRVKAQAASSYVFHMESVGGRAGYLGMSEVIVGDPGFMQTYFDRIKSVTAHDVRDVVARYLTDDKLVTVALYPKGTKTVSSVKSQVMERHITTETLENGLKIVIEEDHNLPLVSVNAVFLGGQRAENKEKSGVGSFMAGMLLKGTDKRDLFQIADAIESRGGQMSAYEGANSFGLRMKVLSQDLKETFDVFADVIRHATFPAEEIEKIRKDVLAGLEQEEKDLFSMGNIVLRKNIFRNHPYGFRLSGSEESVRSMTGGDLKEYYTRLVQPSNMVVTIYGDVVTKDVTKMVRDYFGEWTSVTGTLVINPGLPKGPDHVMRESRILDKEQTLFLLGFATTDIYDKNRFAFEALAEILSGQGGRLFSHIRDVSSLAYSVGAYQQLGIDPGCFVFYVFTVPEEVEQVRQKVIDEIKLIQGGSITEEELKISQNKLIGEKLRQEQSAEGRAFDAALNEIYGLGYDYDEHYSQDIQAVTLDDIKRCAQEYFTLDKYVEVIVGNLGIEASVEDAGETSAVSSADTADSE